MKTTALHHSTDQSPGYTRKKHGSKFVYYDFKGKPIKDKKIVERLNKLAVPPAYHNVWYCTDPQGHLQAVGRDDRGRKQYRYHPDWVATQDEQKYNRMTQFAKALPKMRKTTDHDLKLKGLPQRKVLATVVRLLEKTLIRVGNEEYAKTNNSFGLTTLKDKHVDFKGKKIKFNFKGKSKVVHDIEITDPKLAKIVKACQELPGQDLFQYIDENDKVVDVKSEHVNAYIKEICGSDYTAKDFRTWAGTVLAAKALKEYQDFSSQTEAKKKILQAIESVSAKLGNTKAICRKCYIHPEIFSAYMDGDLAKILEEKASRLLKGDLKNLQREEAAVLVLLEKRLKKESKSKKSTVSSLKPRH